MVPSCMVPFSVARPRVGPVLSEVKLAGE